MWDDQLNIGPRPGTGGSRDRTVQSDLTCSCAAKNESIRTDLSIVVVGWPNATTDSIYLQIETLG